MSLPAPAWGRTGNDQISSQIALTAPDIMTAERCIPVQRRFLRPRPATHSLQGKHILLVPFAELGYQVCNQNP